MFKKPLLKVINREAVNTSPIWLMRQAGRFLPEYRELREKFPSFLDFCLNPDVAAEVTIQPIKRFGFDAAILFADILIVPYALGIDVKFKESIGPILTPVINKDNVNKFSINNLNIKIFEKVNKTVSIVSGYLSVNYLDVTLIGFAGSPWTVACYMVEGGASKTMFHVKQFAYTEEKYFSKLIETITDATIIYLKGQIKAGAEVVKLFDSWAGVLSEEEYRKWVINPTKRIVAEIKKEYPHIPIIGFPKDSGVLYEQYAVETKVDILSVDSTLPLNWIKSNLQDKVIVQGNLDNILLATCKEKIKYEAERIIDLLGNGNFIFNLGHGVLPQTPVENVYELVEIVRNFGRDEK